MKRNELANKFNTNFETLDQRLNELEKSVYIAIHQAGEQVKEFLEIDFMARLRRFMEALDGLHVKALEEAEELERKCQEQADTAAQPYVLLMELLVCILLQAFDLADPGRLLRASSIEMIRNVTPRDVPKARCLNRAVQCLQGLWFRRRKDLVACQKLLCD